MAQSDYFLKLDGIDGESADRIHKETIEISSWSWGESNAVGRGRGGGGGGAGKVQMQDFHFKMDVSKASPKLFLACATGQHIKLATLFVRKAGGDQPQDYLKIELTDILVSSYDVGGGQPSPGDATTPGGDGSPSESLSLNFTKIVWTYMPQSADGSAAAPIVAGWDLATQKKV